MRALATATVMASVLFISGCAQSGAKRPMPQGVGGPSGQPTRVRPSRSTRPVVLPISPKGMRGLRPAQGARFLSSTRLAIPGIAGSSNCPSAPTRLIIESPHSIRIDLAAGSWRRTSAGHRVQVPGGPSGLICLADLHPVPLVIAINPRQIDVYHQLKVSLYYPKFAVRRYKRPVVVTVPPLATARIREEVRVARASSRYFSIFPAVPGKRPCAIPDGAFGTKPFQGICQTSVHPRRTMEPSVSVTFTESWWPHCPPMVACSLRALRHHTWQVIEGETIIKPGTKLHVYATRSRGATPPQLYK